MGRTNRIQCVILNKTEDMKAGGKWVEETWKGGLRELL